MKTFFSVKSYSLIPRIFLPILCCLSDANETIGPAPLQFMPASWSELFLFELHAGNSLCFPRVIVKRTTVFLNVFKNKQSQYQPTLIYFLARFYCVHTQSFCEETVLLPATFFLEVRSKICSGISWLQEYRDFLRLTFLFSICCISRRLKLTILKLSIMVDVNNILNHKKRWPPIYIQTFQTTATAFR